MKNNEQVRPFVFPERGLSLAQPVTGAQAGSGSEQVIAGHRRRSGRDTAHDRRRLREFIRPEMNESNELDKVVETGMRPAFVTASDDDISVGQRSKPRPARRWSVFIETELATEKSAVQEEAGDKLSDEVVQEKDHIEPVDTDDSAAGESAVAAPEKEPSAPAATLQKALDDMFRKGLEQGRQEALQPDSKEVHQQAREQGFEEGKGAGYEEGRKEGHKEGFQEGLKAAQEELSRRFSGIETLIDAVSDHRRLLSRQQVLGAAQLLERLVMEVVRAELRHSPDQIRTLVEEAAHLLDRTEHETVSIRVNPEDAVWLQAFAEHSSESFAIRPDPDITRGGCRIEGRLGYVDATLEERLTDCIEQLRTCLLDDPQEMPPVDLSPVYRQPEPAVANVLESLSTPKPEQASVELPGVPKPSAETTPVMDSFSMSGSTGPSGLGAWGDLGQ